jgi:protocatechuate 3,4-dioxygenase beta subunit
MNWMSLALALVFFQAGAVPQGQQRAAAQDRGAIGGYVVKLGSGEPISKATVTISAFNGGRNASYTATTTAAGQFAFQNLEPGQYRLSVTRNGYVRTEYGARTPNRPGLPITLAAGQAMRDVVLQIVPAGTIAGRVYDRDGEPLANVAVEALKYSYQEGQRVLNQVQTARTNDLGEYRLFWLQPGRYFVSATPPNGQRGALLNALAIGGPGIAGAIGEIIANRGGGPRRGGGQAGGRGGAGQPVQAPGPAQDQAVEGYVPVYYPGTTDSDAAAPINLAPGVLFSGVDLTVATVRTVRVQGQVVDGASGQPATNANVMLVRVQRSAGGGSFRGGIRDAGNFRSQVNNQGVFEIRGLVPGSYEIIAVMNQRNNRMTARMPLEVGAADIQNVSLIVSPGFTLTGRLALEGQPTGAGDQNVQRMRVMLRPDSAASVAGGVPAAPVQPDGSFTLQQVGRDDYRLSVTGMPRNAYVKSARYGGTDVLADDLRLDRQPTGPLEILVSTNTGVADGVVQNDRQEAVTNVTVVFVPESSSRLDLYRSTTSDAAGRFHVEGLPPGNYRVYAWEDIETGAWQDRDFMRQFEDRGRAVRINEGGTTNIELRVIPPQV